MKEGSNVKMDFSLKKKLESLKERIMKFVKKADKHKRVWCKEIEIL